MISYGRQTIDEADLLAVKEALQSDWLTQGPRIEIFENDLKDYFGSKYCSVVSNGTAALHLVALALGWKKDDIILTTPISFVATANCILYAGACVEFVDIDLDTYQIDLNFLELKLKKLQSENKSIKALIAVDYAGNPSDWVELRKLADFYGFTLINDNCHAMGAHYLGNKKYAAEYADVVTQSYHPVKNITTGEGGAVFTNDASINKKICDLRTHGITKDFSKMEQQHGPWYYEMQDLGFNYRITEIQCALGISQLKKLDTFIKRRNEIAAYYDKNIADTDCSKKLKIREGSMSAYHLYPLLISFEDMGLKKEDLFYSFREKGINLQVHYIPIHLQPYYKKNLNLKEGDFPNSEEFYSKAISLPIYPNLNDSESEYLVEEINGVLEG